MKVFSSQDPRLFPIVVKGDEIISEGWITVVVFAFTLGSAVMISKERIYKENDHNVTLSLHDILNKLEWRIRQGIFFIYIYLYIYLYIL